MQKTVDSFVDYFRYIGAIDQTMLEWRLPLLSDGLSSLLQIQRSEFDSLRYQIFWEVVGLERGSLSLVGTIEKLLEIKSSGFGLEKRDYGHRGIRRANYATPSIRKSWH
jgi:hypothetical protein